MKILRLVIENVRGLPDILLEPKGGNLVVWGPNGSGKSGVVDAIDFLLSGDIARLRGRGTGDISLAQHGPHIDASPETARVEATVTLPSFTQPVVVSRSMANPTALQCPDDARPALDEVAALARRGQHILTRREILKFITTEPSDRAAEVQELLNLSDIDALRRTLVTVRNTLRNESASAREAVQTSQRNFASALQVSGYDERRLLEVANEHRQTLGAAPILSLTSVNIRSELNPPSASPTVDINVGLLRKDAEQLRSSLGAEALEVAKESDASLRRELAIVRANPDLLHEMARLELTERGLELLDGSGRCPLCDKNWDPAELKKHLEEKRRKGKEAQTHRTKIRSAARALQDTLGGLKTTLGKVASAATTLGASVVRAVLNQWDTDLTTALGSLADPMARFTDHSPAPSMIARLCCPDGALEQIQDMVIAATAKYPPSTPQQLAWDLLTRAQVRLRDLEQSQARLAAADATASRAVELLAAFERSRDHTLRSLYEQVRDRFVEFYRILHEHEADQFTASIGPVGAGVDFKVDFLGRGAHPPNALHSEGHQDSMGLCLFLALSERLSGPHLNLIVLDDVVMSVDADHRRDVCRLLSEAFPEKQFLLTTHDRTWAMQLKATGVVRNDNLIEFSRWTLETGPVVGQYRDLWDRIEEALEKEDVHDAASRLRRGAENFLEAVCDALRARVPYRTDLRWTLGDWLPAAAERYKSLLAEAKNAANSWGNKDLLEHLAEQDSVRKQIYQRVQVEQWAVNPAVHFTTWETLGSDEFRPVVDAFRDLLNLFQCQHCGEIARLSDSAGHPTGVKCPCANFNWNLEHRT